MIEAKIGEASRAFAARLAGQAAKLAAARAWSALLARRNEPSRWRQANLLWPLFAKDR